ncbi:MAG: hypothetical protein ACKPGN_00770 [Dolichospermum sp.]
MRKSARLSQLGVRQCYKPNHTDKLLILTHPTNSEEGIIASVCFKPDVMLVQVMTIRNIQLK